MDPDAIAPLIGFLGFGTFCLVALRMWLTYRSKRLEIGTGKGTQRLEELVGELRDELRDETRILRGEILDLQERMDFAERLLTRGQGGVEQ